MNLLAAEEILPEKQPLEKAASINMFHYPLLSRKLKK